MNNTINRALKLLKSCPVCKLVYKADDVFEIENDGERVWAHLKCSRCGSSMVAKFFDLPFGMVGSAVLTDLEAQEVIKFKNSEPVSADDVLEVYKQLTNNK